VNIFSGTSLRSPSHFQHSAGSPIVPHATTNLVNGSARSQLPVAVASTSAISPPAPEGKNAELPVLFKPRTPKSSDRNKFLVRAQPNDNSYRSDLKSNRVILGTF
jgi:hypothetical protein